MTPPDDSLGGDSMRDAGTQQDASPAHHVEYKITVRTGVIGVDYLGRPYRLPIVRGLTPDGQPYECALPPSSGTQRVAAQMRRGG